MVPHLTTALTGPLLALEESFLGTAPAIERRRRGRWQGTRLGLPAELLPGAQRVAEPFLRLRCRNT